MKHIHPPGCIVRDPTLKTSVCEFWLVFNDHRIRHFQLYQYLYTSPTVAQAEKPGALRGQ